MTNKRRYTLKNLYNLPSDNRIVHTKLTKQKKNYNSIITHGHLKSKFFDNFSTPNLYNFSFNRHFFFAIFYLCSKAIKVAIGLNNQTCVICAR